MKQLVIMLGKTGSGKDTQADMLVKEFQFGVLRMGDLVRADAAKNKQLAEDLAEGELAPNSVVDGYFDDFIANCNEQLILSDGYPRHIEQANHIRNAEQDKKLEVIAVIYIHLSDNEVYKRLELRMRADDKKDAITERLKEFREETEPVIEYYKKLGKLIHINGEQTVEAVYREIKTKLIEARDIE